MKLEMKFTVDLGEKTLEALRFLGETFSKVGTLAVPRKATAREKVVKLSQLKKNDAVDLEDLPENHKVDLKTAGHLLGFSSKSRSSLRRYLGQGLIPTHDATSPKGEFLWSIAHLKRFVSEKDAQE